MLEVRIADRCDLAVLSAGGYPLDIDFIQTHKSIDHTIDSVRDGGVMIVLAECSSGAGSETFLPWFDLKDRRAVSARLLKQYELNGHTALSLMKKLERVRIVFVSSLAKETVERMGMIPAESLDEALRVAEPFIGDNVLTYVFPCAWGILPVM
jgi:nickel-dependent lactate racemase